MTDLPELTVQDVRNWTNPSYFQRGQSYYNQGRIYNPRRQGQLIKAQCQGSMPEPYRVEITLGAKGIVSGHCSCPVGSGGHCKHSVALLLTWVHEPETFTETETLEVILQKRSKEDLIALILRMVDHAPQLEPMVEMESLVERSEESQLDPGPIQNQVWAALHSGRGDWQDGYYISQQLYDILNTLGARAQELEQWHNAATIYATVAETILEEYGIVYDNEGEVLSVVGECVLGLETCLINID
ncbi:MAG: SWIM zinc finger family protein, partial [Anaerolineae bacterium]